MDLMTFYALRWLFQGRPVMLALIVNGTLAQAQTSFVSETWEFYTNHSGPYGQWKLDKGTWGDLAPSGRGGGKCYSINANVISRVRHEIDLTKCNDIVLQGWLYDSGEGTNRSFLGFTEREKPGANALVRIGTGTPNYANYTVSFFDRLQAKGLITVDTGLPLEKGWHFMRLDLGHDRDVRYHVWSADQTVEKSGRFVWMFDKAKLNFVAVGSLMASSNSVAWDDIKAGPLERVGPPPKLEPASQGSTEPKAESSTKQNGAP